MQRVLTSLDVVPPIGTQEFPRVVEEDDEDDEVDDESRRRRPNPSARLLSGATARVDSLVPELPAEARSTQIDSSVEAASAAAACISSNKHKRLAATSSSKNEDRVYVHRTDAADALFVAVFDGHGGNAHASQFLSEHLHRVYESVLIDVLDEMQQKHPEDHLTCVSPEVVSSALERAFVRTDEKFYAMVKEKASKAGLSNAKARMCRCNFYYEDPCVCMLPPVSANEGSTATVVVVSRAHFVVANVGDSDAYVVRRKTVAPALNENDLFLFRDRPYARVDDNRRLKRVKQSEDESSEREDPPEEEEVQDEEDPAPYFALERLTECDNPSRDHVDFKRISAVAKARRERPLPAGVVARPSSNAPPANGLIESIINVRLNYVCMPGARSLNMARAFGNLGAKTFTETGEFVEKDSGIIARPHLRVVQRTPDMCALILGSDGLWDNLNANEVGDTLMRIFPRHPASLLVNPLEHQQQQQDLQFANVNSDDSLIFGESAVNKTDSTSAHHAAAKKLLARALSTQRKPDDISVVVVALSSSSSFLG